MKRWLKIMYVKWVLRQCPHFCMFCKYKDVSKEDDFYEFERMVK